MDNLRTYIDSFREPKRYHNLILDLAPFSKLNLALAFLVGGILLKDNYIKLALIIACFAVVMLAGKDSFVRFIKIFFTVSAVTFFFLLVLNSVFREGEPLWQVGSIVFSREGFTFGLNMAISITQICACFLLFFIVTPMKDMVYSLEKIGLSRSAAYILLASLQSITDLKKQANTILESQSARGIETQGSLSVRIKAFVPVVFPLFLGSIAATEEKTIAMETRAFSAGIRATHLHELRKVPIGEIVFGVLLDAFVLGLIVWRWTR